MKSITTIDKFTEGAKVQGFYLCSEKHIRHTRAGDLYLDLVLRDRTGSISAKIWDKIEKYANRFENSDPVAVSGLVETYQDRMQLVIKKINRATIQHYARYGYDPALIVPASVHDPNEMWLEIVALIRQIRNPWLKKLVSALYRENKDRLLILPASMLLHHDYRSGFLEHTLSMARIGLYLAKHYSLDSDLLLAGILLHDIGKIRELHGDLETSYSDEGNFIGHIVIGYDIISEKINQIDNFPTDLSLKIKHMILAHQGNYEWGSPRKPAFRVALLLHMIDNLDAKMKLMEKILSEDQNEGNWTDLRNYFRTAIHKESDASGQIG